MTLSIDIIFIFYSTHLSKNIFNLYNLINKFNQYNIYIYQINYQSIIFIFTYLLFIFFLIINFKQITLFTHYYKIK